MEIYDMTYMTDENLRYTFDEDIINFFKDTKKQGYTAIKLSKSVAINLNGRISVKYPSTLFNYINDNIIKLIY